MVCIFPEGGLTPDGSVQEFKSGIERIIKETPVPVIPMALNNLWGSLFSRKDKVLERRPKKFLAKIHLNIGNPIKPTEANRTILYQKVIELKKQA